jgi:hypothetical protein
MDAPERYEQLIAFLGAHLTNERHELADGSLQFVGGDPPEVVALVEENSVAIYAYAGVWSPTRGVTPRPRRVGLLKWRRLPETALFNALGVLIKGAREARLASFRTCQECGRSTPPEWMDADQTCRTCSDRLRREDVVH